MGKSFSCFIVGADSLLIECGEILLSRGHTILGVLSSAPRIVDWSRRKGLRIIDPGSEYCPILREQPFDYLFSITHLAILPDDVVALPWKGAINFHDGPLPRYAGLNAPVWALINREPTYGITWHWMTSQIDQGDILKQRLFEIAPGETSLSLNTRCLEAGIETFAELVDEFAAETIAGRKQNLAERTNCGRFDRPPGACFLDWRRSAEDLEALVRALDFGRYDNPVGSAKVVLGDEIFIVTRAVASDESSNADPGTVLAIGPQEIRVATGNGTLSLTALSSLFGQSAAIDHVAAKRGVKVGQRLAAPSPESFDALSKLNAELSRSEGFWVRRLARMEPIEVPYAHPSERSASESRWRDDRLDVPEALGKKPGSGLMETLTAAFGSFLARLGNKSRFHFSYSNSALRQRIRGFENVVSAYVPLEIDQLPTDTFETARAKLAAELKDVGGGGTWLKDAVARFGELHGHRERTQGALLTVGVEHLAGFEGFAPAEGLQLALVISEASGECRLYYDESVFSANAIATLSRQFSTFLTNAAAHSGRPVTQLDVLSSSERHRLLMDWNRTDTPYRRDACLHHLVEEQAERSPESIALVFEDQSLTYRQLDERANQLAGYLRRLGIGPDRLVGVYVERSLDLIVATLAVLKAGGAYVPLDPSFPRERIAFMIEDSKTSVIITQNHLAKELPASSSRIVRIDADWPLIAREPRTANRGEVKPANLAYVIYTSGSTGKPKGVMVEHHNVVNFFAGMDAQIPDDPPGTWLAVTTLSFDISVLELFWTLAHGFKVVLYKDPDRQAFATLSSRLDRAMDLALFFWGNDDGPGPRKYELLLEAAKFADANGFSAVWTPERHFHAFGGPYPNPSVVGAALAATTSRVQIRAGSCVLPLHHPIRVAEEWSVIDNLSNGRVAVSFASGWQPHDFVLRPEAYKDNKTTMFRDIETVRRLWRGESVAFPGPFGDLIERTTLPRPVQPELPIWITSAGNPETYRQAGSIGANVLTHLLGQSAEEVAGKVRIYREARAAAGHDPDAGQVTLMLHTFVGKDDEEVRRIVRDPMKEYLRSSVNLLKQFAWTFPAFKRPGGADAKPDDIDLGSLTAEEMDGILEHAFLRYFETSGLFGTPQTCLRMIDQLKSIGVTEIACLIDFGIDAKTVLDSLPYLNTVRELANPVSQPADRNGRDFSFPALVRNHRVTHMQCTPSMARMFLDNEETRVALASIANLFIGGEAFPTALARELREFPATTITNMYGPTETTVWSATHCLDGVTQTIPIGRPIANTRLYILNDQRQPVPPGVPGELYIGGDGVVRGYLHRPELTAERFLPDPFRPGERIYKTGDLARFDRNGLVEFLGRNDFQVKIRGYRIELGEIEACVAAHESIREAVVIAREDAPGDPRLVAYAVVRGVAPSPGTLRESLRKKLPDYMIPAHFVFLDRLPLTPNGKVDRKALPAPQVSESRPAAAFTAPADELEKGIAGLWRETLAVQEVGIDDNFFDIGGHSLLVVRMHRRVKELFEQPVALTDLYRFPTIRSFAEFLRGGGDGRIQHSSDRAQMRRDAMQRRRGIRGEKSQLGTAQKR